MKQLLLVSQFFIMSITTYAQSLGPQTFNTSGEKAMLARFIWIGASVSLL
jgi:hypothetical protein